MKTRKLSLEELKNYYLNGPKYNSWTLVTDEYFSKDDNIEKICYDGHGYCILDGNNRVDVWNPDYPNSDIYKEQREKYNNK